jgi:hypothetical protein
MTAQLRGVLTALATPFAADGSVDEARLRALVDRSIDGGVHGVVACGSTGEFSALSGDERRLVVETVVDQAARRVPVIAQTGATSTAEAIRLSRHAQSAGVDVVMPVAPYYEALSVEETLTYLRAVAGSVDIPVMLYNLPMATGVDLHPDTVGALAREVENIRYIKNTTIDMAQSAQLIHNHGDVISTFVGWDSLLLSAPGRGRRGRHGGDGERRARRARGRLRRRERRRPREGASSVGADLSAHRRDDLPAVHRGGQGRPGGGKLPHRRAPRTGRRARPRRGRPHREARGRSGRPDPRILSSHGQMRMR